ncbi:MAG: MaoC family dehydratase [Pseudomonadota bacterium]|nr:MaoC family dehydratase [Pseudomonadota bacterium]
MPRVEPGVGTHDFTVLPPLLPSYLRALLGACKPATAGHFPPLAASVRGVSVDAQHVARFRRAFELPAAGPVPPTYAHVLAGPLQLYLLTHPDFPLRVPGTVHVQNPVRQWRALRVGERVDLAVSLSGPRSVAQGIEHELCTEVRDAGGALIWRGVSTNLLRRPGAARALPQTVAGAAAPAWERAWRLWLPADAGRRYATLSGDWNPIHLSWVTARLFGFRRAIIHGMWTYARALAALEPQLDGEDLELDVRFRRPLLLPGHATLRAARRDGGWDWVLQDPQGRVSHAQGSVRPPQS